MYDAVIIGAGPAGLTGALYLLRASKTVLVLEAKHYGGQIADAVRVENYPGIASVSGFDFANRLYNQVKALGAEFRHEAVTGIHPNKTVFTDTASYTAKAVIIATGAAKRKLQLPNEQALTGRGVSYCAVCDGNFYRGKTVAVVGGGNTALEDALYLTDIASQVYLIHRRDTFRGEAGSLRRLQKKPNAALIVNANVTALTGRDKLESVTVTDRFGKTREIRTDGLFVAIGQEPQSKLFSAVARLSPDGYIESPDGVHTGTEGIYVAGDVRAKEVRQLTTAVSDGSVAAAAAIREMKGDQ